MCRALYDLSVAYGVPLTSGKDSMKNDFVADGQKISVPPTVLYSMVAAIDDVRRTVTSEFKCPGDLIYQVGPTYDEMGGSAFYRLLGALGANVPRVRPDRRRRPLSRAVGRHRGGPGGLVPRPLRRRPGGGLGGGLFRRRPRGAASRCRKRSSNRRRGPATGPIGRRSSPSPTPASWSGSTRRRAPISRACSGRGAVLIGEVTTDPRLSITWEGEPVADLATGDLLAAWQGGLGL